MTQVIIAKQAKVNNQIEILAQTETEAKTKLCPVVAYTLIDVFFDTEKQSKVFLFDLTKNIKPLEA